VSECDTGARTAEPFLVLAEAFSFDRGELNADAPIAGGTSPSEGEQLVTGEKLEVGLTAIMFEQFIQVFLGTSNHSLVFSFPSTYLAFTGTLF
jgi:hypothetical protein